MSRPRRQIYTMKQYLNNVKKGVITNDADTQRTPAWKAVVDGLAVTILTDDYIPAIILAEEDCGQTHIVDGGSRTGAFMMIRYGNYKIKSSVEDPIITYKRMTKDENGKSCWENATFDIRNKTFSAFPDELKEKFDEYHVETVIHEHCNSRDNISMYMKRYNERKNFTASQKQFLYLPKFAEKIRDITKMNFFINNCVITEKEKENGNLERVVAESIMTIFHLDFWNKNGKKAALYLNENATNEEFDELSTNIASLESIVTDETKVLFNNKDAFIWFAAFNKFTELFNLEGKRFGEFMTAFVHGLKDKMVDGQLFEKIDDCGSTKDKSNILSKLHIITELMKEFFAESTENEPSVDEFIAEVCDMPLNSVREDMDYYQSTLDEMKINYIKDGSKLLDEKNNPSLLALVAYSCFKDIDIDSWLKEYAINTNLYMLDQKKNFLLMKEDLMKYLRLHNSRESRAN